MDETQKKLSQYFSGKLDQFGATPKGVDYNGPEAQTLRFEQLVKVIDPSKPFSVIDYGSGYGAMFDFLHAKGWTFEYYGIDLIEKMVLAGRTAHKEFPNAHFTTNEQEVPVADYLLAGAIFNIKLEESYSAERWSAKNSVRARRKGFSAEEAVVGDAVALAGEGGVHLKVFGGLTEEVQLQDLGLAHLGFDLEEQPAQAFQVVFPFPVFPALMLQEVEVLGPGQLAEGDDFAH